MAILYIKHFEDFQDFENFPSIWMDPETFIIVDILIFSIEVGGLKCTVFNFLIIRLMLL